MESRPLLDAWRTAVNPLDTPLVLGSALALSSSGLRGYRFSEMTYISLQVIGLLPGPVLVTVFVNGIPSQSQPLLIRYRAVFLPFVCK